MQLAENPSFRKWLFSTHELLEKAVGLIVLTVEIFAILQEVFFVHHKVVLTHSLNLLFLIFIFWYLRRDFAKQFAVNVDDIRVARALRLSHSSIKHTKISDLIFHSNTFISQFRNINYFVLATAGLYCVFLARVALFAFFPSHKPLITYSSHLAIDLLSYFGAFFLLRCFFVMYLPTIDKNGNDILNRKTLIYLLLLVALMLIDASIMFEPHGLFLSEFICGVVNSVVFVLLIARFENKILDIPPVVLCFLYVYAILQTCLPFVTGDVFGDELLDKIPSVQVAMATPNLLDLARAKEAFTALEEKFTYIVLALCLVGKITLSTVLLYVLRTKRIFYYFMSFKPIYDQEDKAWREFFPMVVDFPISNETFSISFHPNKDSTYTARIHGLFEGASGTGRTPDEAKEELLVDIAGTRGNGI